MRDRGRVKRAKHCCPLRRQISENLRLTQMSLDVLAQIFAFDPLHLKDRVHLAAYFDTLSQVLKWYNVRQVLLGEMPAD